MSSSKKRIDRGRKIASPPETASIAISLAKLAGWYVFPVTVYEDASGKRHKVPAVKWKEWATNDPKTIAKAWAGEHSGRWIGVYAERSGILVGDLDPAKPRVDKKTGKPTGEMTRSGAESVKRAGLELPKTFDYPTHRAGGRHYVYTAPEGVELTIGTDVPGPDGEKLEGVDVRAGGGLTIYYGPELKKAPKLAPAPDWLIVTRDAPRYNGGSDAAPTADETAFRERIAGGKPDPETAELVRAIDFPAGAAHDNMLEVVTHLVRLGAQGEPGIGKLLDETRDRYVGSHPDRPRDWANALEGSIRRLGLPPVTLELSKTERKAIARRNDPESDEHKAADAARKADFKAKKNAAAVSRKGADEIAPAGEKVKAGKIAPLELDEEPDDVMPGDRVLEDGPLAAELSWKLRRSWAYSRGYGLMRWKGDRWASAEEHSLVNAVRKLIVEIEVDEHTAAAMRGDNKAIDKARTLLSRNRAVNVARLVVGILAENEPRFDAHPDLLNTPSGVVDLRTGKLKKHRPEYFFTRITGAPYDPKADMRLWKRALEAIPADTRAWLKLRFGQAATGYTPDDDRLLIFEGSGQNGKSTVVTAPANALGDTTEGGYAATLPERLLLANPGDHPTTLMSLQGARVGTIEELPEGRSLNVKRLKDTVGTPKITARRMRSDDVTFKTTHALFLNTNYLPIVAETDHGTWRRLAIVRFRKTYVEDAADADGKRKLAGDPAIRRHFEDNADPGVLRWIVEGAVAWYANGRRFPKMPERIKRDTAQWRMDADPILAYVAERIVRDDGFAITAADLAEDFNVWLHRRGHKEWSQQTINSRLQGHVSFDGVDRKPVKWSGAIHPSRPSAFNMRPIPKVTTAWRGVRFIDEPARLPSEAELDAATIADLDRRASR